MEISVCKLDEIRADQSAEFCETSARAIPLRLQEVGHRPFADSNPGGQAVVARRPEVDAPVDTTGGRLSRRCDEAAERPRHTGNSVRPDGEVHLIRPEKLRQDGRRRTAERAVA